MVEVDIFVNYCLFFVIVEWVQVGQMYYSLKELFCFVFVFFFFFLGNCLFLHKLQHILFCPHELSTVTPTP
jgi:hypothetical protein